MLHNLKLATLWIVSWIPGKIGSEAETRRLRRWKKARGPAAVAEFEKRLLTLSSDSIAIDLGANMGEYTEKMAAHAGHVHAFEPDPWSFKQLEARVGHLGNVSLHNVAVAAENKKVTMRRNIGFSEDPVGASLGTSILEHSGPLDSEEMFDVDCIDFREFLRGLDSRAALVKIDIEGSEIPLLDGLLGAPELALIDAMFVETHEVNMSHLRSALRRIKKHFMNSNVPYVNFDWP